MAARREFLSAYATLGTREKVYAVADALEIDEYAVGEIERRRVFFDDVLALTRHRYRGLGFTLFTGFAGTVFLLIALGLTKEEAVGGVVTMLIFASIFYLALLVRLVFGVDVIVVYGRRSSARLRFSLRKGKAERVFQRLRRRIREVQDAAAAARAAEAPPPAVEPVLAPPPEAVPPSPEVPPPPAP